MRLTEVLLLRSEFEFTTKTYNMPEGSDIDTIEWFIENGHRSNSLRKGFDTALNLAKRIKEFSDGCTKKLEPGSKYANFDKDGDGIVTDEEFEMEQKLVQLENEDKKQDAQRNMAWFALGGMLLYPAFVIAATLFGLDNAAKITRRHGCRIFCIGCCYCCCILWQGSISKEKINKGFCYETLEV